jgi:tRNA A37 threonylcarbamoyladenosine biosynthesis protein TsaE
VFSVFDKKGSIVLIGKVGCSKTTLCRHFLATSGNPLADHLRPKPTPPGD